MTKIRYFLILKLFFALPVIGSAEIPVVVLIDFHQGKNIVYIDGVVADGEGVYEALRKPMREKGRKAEVNLLFNPKVRFFEVVNTRKILQAIGFSDIKVYYLGENKNKMAEIEFNKPAVVVPKWIYKK